MRRLSHCKNRRLQTLFTAERASHRQKFRGVLRSGCAQPNHGIIAGVFALAAKAARREPEDGVKPVDRARRASKNLHAPVVSLNVGKLMSQDHANAVIGPAFSVTRE